MLPTDYLKNGYHDEKGNLLREVIVEHAKSISEQLSSKDMTPVMTSVQLRRFYGLLHRIKNKYLYSKDFDLVRPQIDKLSPQVEYAYKREVVPKLFVDFINKNVEKARQDEKNLLGFFQHYQSVVAYFKDSSEKSQKKNTGHTYQKFNKGYNHHKKNDHRGGFRK